MESIDSKVFFLLCLGRGMHLKRSWLLHAFSLTRKSAYWDEDFHPYKEDGKWLVKLPEVEERVQITGELYTDSGLILYKRQKIDLKAGDIPGLKENVSTYVGRVLWHFVVKVYPFGEKLPFVNDKERVGDVENIISKLLTDNPEDPTAQRDPSKIYVDELLKFTESAGMYLAGMTQLFTPGTTRKSLTTDPKVYVVRDKMLVDAAKRGRIHDPAEIAKIKKELVAIDREYIKGDPAEDYLIGKKSFNIIRSKVLLMHGEELGFGDGTQVSLIPTSIDEGLDLKYFPEYVNSVREGSYNRGHQTMLGGEAFAFLSRIFQNTAIVEEDCGRTIGRPTRIFARIADEFVGYFAIVQKKVVEITSENIGQFAGKTVVLRSSQYCGTKGGNFCATCMGRQNAKSPKALGSTAADVGSMMLAMFMKKAHATELRTYRYDPFKAFS